MSLSDSDEEESGPDSARRGLAARKYIDVSSAELIVDVGLTFQKLRRLLLHLLLLFTSPD